MDFESSIAENRFIVRPNINPVIDESEWYPMDLLFLMEKNVSHILVANKFSLSACKNSMDVCKLATTECKNIFLFSC